MLKVELRPAQYETDQDVLNKNFLYRRLIQEKLFFDAIFPKEHFFRKIREPMKRILKEALHEHHTKTVTERHIPTPDKIELRQLEYMLEEAINQRDKEIRLFGKAEQKTISEIGRLKGEIDVLKHKLGL